MKKFKLKVLLPLVALVALGVGSFTAFGTSAVSANESLLLANVEALAQNESGNGCYDTYDRSGDVLTNFKTCGSCEYMNAYNPRDRQSC